MVANVDMLCAGMKIVGLNELKGGQVTAMESTVGTVTEADRSPIMQCRKMYSFAACVTETHLASAVERVTSSCFRELQEPVPPSMMKG
jgi:hypothetical protein